MTQNFDYQKVQSAINAFRDFQLYSKDKTSADKDIQILRNYAINTEADVKQAFESVVKRLENIDDISFSDYGGIATALVQIEYDLDYDIEKAKKLLVSNLKGRGDKIRIEHIFSLPLDRDDVEIQNEYRQLRYSMEYSLKSYESIPGFNYLPEQANLFWDYTSKNAGKFHLRNGFAKELDMERLAQMFANASPIEKHQIRSAFQSIYREPNIKTLFPDDRRSIETLLGKIKSDYEKCNDDGVQKLQYKWFVNNLTDIIQRLS